MTIPIEKLLKEVDSYYKLVLVAAKRANDLTGGAQPLVVGKSKKMAINALQEIARGKIHVDLESREKKSKAKKASAKPKKSES
jgi:DNA-directed RNA polymerase omega subunit